MILVSKRPPLAPLLFVAGFAIVIAVNGIMAWLAVSSFSGLYSANAREHGVHYNQAVSEQRARDKLGWKVVPDWRGDRLQLTLTRATGAPLLGARVSAQLVRPVEKRSSIPLVWTDAGNGMFSAKVNLPERGNWDIDIVVDAEGHHFAETRRMFLE
jgi:nitrogen fixation protein FixH